MNLDNVTRDDWIVGGLAILLAITLIFFPWFHVSVTAGPISVSASASATGAPDGWLGVLAFLAALAVVADLAIDRLSPQTQIPAIRESRATTRLVLAAAAAVFVALKFLLHIHFSYFGWGFYAAVVLAAALVFFTVQAREAEHAGGPTPTTPTGTAPPPPPSAAAGSSAPPPAPPPAATP